MSDHADEKEIKDYQEKKTKKKKPGKMANGEFKEQIIKQETNSHLQEKNVVEDKEKSNIEDKITVNSKTNEINPPLEEANIKQVRETDLMKLSELKEAFKLFDFNRDGIIDLQDLKFTFASMGKIDISEEQLQKMLSDIPNPITFDIFITLFGSKVSEMDPEEVFTKALSKWDMKENGMISEERIRNDLQKFGDTFTPREVDYALEEAPVYIQENVSMIDYRKFSNNICGFRNLMKSKQYLKDLENA